MTDDYTTLLLARDTWDLVVDNKGDIAVATGPYARAQDAASACKLFQSELLYDTTQGIPYWERILGRWPPASLVKSKWTQAAFTVPGVLTAKAFITRWDATRVVHGQVQITDANSPTPIAVSI